MIQALAAGNAVLAVGANAQATLQPLLGRGFPLAAGDGTLLPEALQELDIDLVAASGALDWMAALRRALAKREGAIVPLVSELLYPAAYVHERAVCVDTTAAGGNASLMATA